MTLLAEVGKLDRACLVRITDDVPAAARVQLVFVEQLHDLRRRHSALRGLRQARDAAFGAGHLGLFGVGSLELFVILGLTLGGVADVHGLGHVLVRRFVRVVDGVVMAILALAVVRSDMMLFRLFVVVVVDLVRRAVFGDVIFNRGLRWFRMLPASFGLWRCHLLDRRRRLFLRGTLAAHLVMHPRSTH